MAKVNLYKELKMAKIIGLGGVFFKAKSPLALANWYTQYLGLDIMEWGGAVLPLQGIATANPDAFNLWAPMEKKTDYFAPSTQNFMVNFVVDDLQELVNNLKEQDQAISEVQQHEHGKFAWIMDPEGNKVELWEPNKFSAADK